MEYLLELFHNDIFKDYRSIGNRDGALNESRFFHNTPSLLVFLPDCVPLQNKVPKVTKTEKPNLLQVRPSATLPWFVLLSITAFRTLRKKGSALSGESH